MDEAVSNEGKLFWARFAAKKPVSGKVEKIETF